MFLRRTRALLHASWLRWILVELSADTINGVLQFRSLYLWVAKKHGCDVSRVTVARAMLKTIYAMLTKLDMLLFKLLTSE